MFDKKLYAIKTLCLQKYGFLFIIKNKGVKILDSIEKVKKSTLEQSKKHGISNWELMILAEEQDCEVFEAQDFDLPNEDYKKRYKEFYDDVKHSADYIKEDW